MALVRGWFAYFKHSKKTAFEAQDGWVRVRLRGNRPTWAFYTIR
ncbi:MAG: group II intron maturase-specific domain-containing protein [Candidatus Hydrogenedentota bacterium]